MSRKVQIIFLATLAVSPVQAQDLSHSPNVRLAGGSDIVRILPPEFSQPTPTPPAPPKAQPTPPSPPEKRADPAPPFTPPPTPTVNPPTPTPPPPREEKANVGEFVKLPVRLGTLTSDPTKASMGAMFDSLDRSLASAMGLINPAGALIIDAGQNSPAMVAGVRTGDVVVSFNGGPVTDPADLRRRIQILRPGDTATVEVWRYKSDLDFIATLRRFAEQGNAAVMQRLAHMYARGQGVPRDETEAVRWYRTAASAGNTVAMTELAMMLFEGRGAPANSTEALRLLKQAADSGYPMAQWRYAGVLNEGKYTTKDSAQAVAYYTRAAEAGNSPAMVDLGLMHANGNGVPRNYQEAARWYQKAIALNHPAAMVNMGVLYQRGNGVEKNDTEAANLYRRAVALNQPSGMHNLAALMDSGRGVPRDSEQAAELLMRSLRAGHEFTYMQMMKNGNGYTRELRQSMQRRLKEEGLYNGPIDGDFGQTTQAALSAFYNKYKK